MLQVSDGESEVAAVEDSHLSRSGSEAPGPVHDAGDGGQSLLTPPQSFLSAQVSRYGGADQGGRAANEAASDGQEDGVYHLVIRGTWKGRETN